MGVLPTEPTLFKPCPKCDGWLKAKRQDYNPIGLGYFKRATIWDCTVCDEGAVDASSWISAAEYEELG